MINDSEITYDQTIMNALLNQHVCYIEISECHLGTKK